MGPLTGCSDDASETPSGGAIAESSDSGTDGPAKIDPRAFDGKEGATAARALNGLYAGLGQAIDSNMAPLALNADPRAALEQVDEVEGLTKVCDVMSDEAQASTVRYAKAFARFEDFDWTCERAMAWMLRNAKVNRGLDRLTRTKIVGINIEGDRGTATLSHGRHQPLTTLPIVKDNGAWKIASQPGAAE